MATRFASCFLSGLFCVLSGQTTPQLHRLAPLGAMRGTTVEVELIGEKLGTASDVRFDTPDLVWTETLEAAETKVRGKVTVAPQAALGPHIVYARLKNGRTNSRLFNVTQFPSLNEIEPNDPPKPPQQIELVGMTSAWKYLDDNTAPSSTWKTAAFDDTTWKSGEGLLFAGDADASTAGEGLYGYWALDESSGTTRSFRRVQRADDDQCVLV